MEVTRLIDYYPNGKRYTYETRVYGKRDSAYGTDDPCPGLISYDSNGKCLMRLTYAYHRHWGPAGQALTRLDRYSSKHISHAIPTSMYWTEAGNVLWMDWQIPVAVPGSNLQIKNIGWYIEKVCDMHIVFPDDARYKYNDCTDLQIEWYRENTNQLKKIRWLKHGIMHNNRGPDIVEWNLDGTLKYISYAMEGQIISSMHF